MRILPHELNLLYVHSQEVRLLVSPMSRLFYIGLPCFTYRNLDLVPVANACSACHGSGKYVARPDPLVL